MAEYYFELPSLSLLNSQQQSTLYERNSVRVYGGAGTGKSVVAVYRHIANWQNNQSSVLLTYTTALAFYLKKTCLNASNLNSIDAQKAANHVSSTYQWISDNQRSCAKFGELIVDEAQDVQINNYKVIKNKCNRIFYSADPNQCLYNKEKDYYGRPLIINEMENLFSDAQEYVLEQNYRNSKEILEFVRAFFPEANIESRAIQKAKSGNRPRLIRVSRYEAIDTIRHIIKRIKSETTFSTHNIAVLAPFQKNVKELYEALYHDFPEASVHSSDYGKCEQISNIHFTTFKSSKGLEFDTVIIPSFELAVTSLDRWDTLKWEDFYVAMTRSKANLFLLSSIAVPQINNYVD